MGLAKYAEDNNEIYLERMYYQREKSQEYPFRITTIVTPTIDPLIFSVSLKPKKTPKSKERVIECCDCGRKFLFTTGEQRFYASHQYQLPKRCKACRQRNKLMKERRFWNGLL